MYLCIVLESVEIRIKHNSWAKYNIFKQTLKYKQ